MKVSGLTTNLHSALRGEDRAMIPNTTRRDKRFSGLSITVGLSTEFATCSQENEIDIYSALSVPVLIKDKEISFLRLQYSCSRLRNLHLDARLCLPEVRTGHRGRNCLSHIQRDGSIVSTDHFFEISLLIRCRGS